MNFKKISILIFILFSCLNLFLRVFFPGYKLKTVGYRFFLPALD